MLIAGVFDGHIRNISNLDDSIYATFTVSSALELPADLLCIWGLNFFGRRWSAVGSMALSGVCMLVCPIIMGEKKTIGIGISSATNWFDSFSRHL